MEHFDKATLDRFVESMTPVAQPNGDTENKVFFSGFDDDNKQNITAPIESFTSVRDSLLSSIAPNVPKKVSLASSNDADIDYDSATPQPANPIPKNIGKSSNINPPLSNGNIFSEDSEAVPDDPSELAAIRQTLQDLVICEAESRGLRIQIPPTNQQPKYGDDPKENHLITLMNQQSLHGIIQSVSNSPQQPTSYNSGHSRPSVSYESINNVNGIHPAVQKLYQQQQTLLQKLQLLEKDDPDPQSAKLWGIMQRIFTEENAEERRRNIEDLTNTLDKKHQEMYENENDGQNVSVGEVKGPQVPKRRNSKALRKMDRFEKWMVNEVALPQYIDNFHANNYDRIDVVKTLKESDLREIGVSKTGHRRLIMEKIQDLQSKHGGKEENELLKSIHELSKETHNELKEMRQQLNEERKINHELRGKIRKKNRQLKMLVNNHEAEDGNEEYTAPVAYDSNNNPNIRHQPSLGSVDSAFSLTQNVNSNDNNKPSTFQSWCINMGFQPSKTKCSWF